MAQQREFTPQDEVRARLIGILMVNAKFLQLSRRDTVLNKEALREHMKFLLSSLMQLTGGDGKQLEKDVLALAKDIGFVVEQHDLSKSGGAN